MKTAAVFLFVLMYLLMIARPKERPVYALLTAAVFLVTGVLPVRDLLSVINWNVLMMISGTMIIVYYFIEFQMPNLLADLLLERSGNVMWVTIYMSLFAGVISAFIDNIPYVAAMLPVLTAVTGTLGMEPYLLYFGLLSGATLGGNITPIGAPANITAAGLLKKNGYEVSFGEFMRIGGPYTLTAVTVGCLYFWLLWR